MADDEGWLVAGLTEPDDIRRHYDEWADRYDDDLAAWRYDAPSIVADLVARFADRPSSLLDAGCGTGLVGRAVRATGYAGELVGIDLSERSTAAALATGAYDAVGVADLQRPLTFPDAAFGAVTCVGVLTYVPDTRAIWSEFLRVLRPGGVFVCTQRDDMWEQRRCADLVHAMEAGGEFTVVHLSAPAGYLPGNPDFADAINVRHLAARRR